MGRGRPVEYFRKRAIGQTEIMSNGLTCQIIDYVNFGSITVRFEDGVVVNTTMFDFRNRTVKHTSGVNSVVNKNKVKYVGMVSTMKCGYSCEIIRYGGCGDLDVMFEDGSVVSHVTTQAFNVGTIIHPKLGRIPSVGEPEDLLLLYNYLHEFLPSIGYRCNMGDRLFGGSRQASVTIYCEELKLAIDVIRYDISMALEKYNAMLSSGLIEKLYILTYERDIPYDRVDGAKVMCISRGHLGYDLYSICKHILEDCGISYDSLVSLEPEIVDEHIGLRLKQNCGWDCEIISYVNTHNITVLFEDGYELEGVSLSSFRKRELLHPKWGRKLRDTDSQTMQIAYRFLEKYWEDLCFCGHIEDCRSASSGRLITTTFYSREHRVVVDIFFGKYSEVVARDKYSVLLEMGTIDIVYIISPYLLNLNMENVNELTIKSTFHPDLLTKLLEDIIKQTEVTSGGER